MPKISKGSAIGAGFRLIGREPTAVLVWLGAYLIYAVVMWGLMFAAAPGFIGQYMAALRNATSQPDAAAFEGLVGSMQGLWILMPFLVIAGLVVSAMLLGAIYRAVLQPEMRSRAYLRFGRAELWLLLSFLAWLVVSLVVYFAVVLGGMLVAGLSSAGAVAAGGSRGGALGALLMIVAMIGGLVATLWIVMRLSVGLPISFDQSRFALFDGWVATRGQGGRLLLVGLGLLGILILFELAAALLFGFVVGIGAVAGGGAAPPASALMVAIWAVLGSVFGLGFFVILAAPSADIYRQLKGEDLSVFS